MLPVRYYIPPSDVRLDLMEESPKRTVCPYKGQASYWTYPPPEQGRNIAWSYDRRFLDAAQIHGLVSFFNERVDITVDGVRQERPVTPWSRRTDRRHRGCEHSVRCPERTSVFFGSLSPALGDDCPHWKR